MDSPDRFKQITNKQRKLNHKTDRIANAKRRFHKMRFSQYKPG